MFEYRVMIDQKLGLALVFGFLVLIEKPWFLRFEIYNRAHANQPTNIANIMQEHN